MPRIEMLLAGLATSKGKVKSSDRAKTLPVGSGTLRSRSGQLLSSPTRSARSKRGGPKRPDPCSSALWARSFPASRTKRGPSTRGERAQVQGGNAQGGRQHRLLIDVALHNLILGGAAAVRLS